MEYYLQSWISCDHSRLARMGPYLRQKQRQDPFLNRGPMLTRKRWVLVNRTFSRNKWGLAGLLPASFLEGHTLQRYLVGGLQHMGHN